jgi:hypothetical protein
VLLKVDAVEFVLFLEAQPSSFIDGVIDNQGEGQGGENGDAAANSLRFP